MFFFHVATLGNSDNATGFGFSKDESYFKKEDVICCGGKERKREMAL